jgi:hypothetical protein
VEKLEDLLNKLQRTMLEIQAKFSSQSSQKATVIQASSQGVDEAIV